MPHTEPRKALAVMGDRKATSYVLAHLPRDIKVLYLGFEVGINVGTGAALTSCAAASNPCRQA